MLSKWEWISRKCMELGLEKSGRIAERIEIILRELYGNTITPSWERDYPLFEVYYSNSWDEFKKCLQIYHVAIDGRYCIACIATRSLYGKKACQKCRFGEIVGICEHEDSVFSKFIRIFGVEVFRKLKDYP